MSRCLDPQTAPEKTFGGSKHLFTRYLEDFGRLGLDVIKDLAKIRMLKLPYPGSP